MYIQDNVYKFSFQRIYLLKYISFFILLSPGCEIEKVGFAVEVGRRSQNGRNVGQDKILSKN